MTTSDQDSPSLEQDGSAARSDCESGLDGSVTQRLGSIYSAHNARRGRGFIFGGSERAAVMRSLLQARDGPILDLGCRDGALTSALQLETTDVVGTDIDSDALRAARDRGLHVCEANLWGGFPFRSNSVRSIVAGEILEHVPFPDHFLAEVARILLPGGRVVGSVPNSFRLKNRLRFLLGKPIETDPTHLKQYSPEVLRRLLETHFVKVKIVPCVGRLVPLHSRLFGNDLVWTASRSDP